MKKIIAMVLVIALTAAVSVGLTLAYLTDTDEAVNVMTMGNVKIQQIEQERIDTTKLPTADNLQKYTQSKPAYPAVYSGSSIPWDAASTANQAWKVVEPNENVIDKFVTVKNTGKSDAYVRTWFAVEVGPDGVNSPYMHVVTNSTNITEGATWTWEWAKDEEGNTAVVTISGQDYMLYVATYTEELEPGVTTIPSLKQLYLDKTATNEVCALYGNTYEVLAFTQAVQAAGFGSPEAALDAAFGKVSETNHPWAGEGNAPVIPVVVSSAEELKDALAVASAAKAGDNTIYLASDITLTEDWTPISVDGYHGAGIVTVEGQGHTITGLTAPLFDGGFAGESGIIIRNLTIADSDIQSGDTQGAGAFISCVDSMTTIILENCHLLNSSVYAPEARTGGLIGWTSGYSRQDDGPVKTYVTITDCSVQNCEITGTAVGGINGHAGASDWTYTTITNCTVMNNNLVSTDDGDWRVGAVIGTANVGEVTITGTVTGGNTMTQEAASSQRADGLSDLVGRFVPGTTGKLTIEGTVTAAIATSNDEFKAAIAEGVDSIVVNNATLDLSAAIGVNGADITVNGGVVNTTSTNYTGIQQSGVVTYNDVTFNGGTFLYGEKVVFNNCEFNLTTNYVWTYGAKEVEFNNCTFNTDGKAILVFQDGSTNDCVVTVKDCTFNATAAAYTWDNKHVSAVSIDGTNGTYVVNFEGTNIVDEDFNGLWQIKAGEANVTVNE